MTRLSSKVLCSKWLSTPKRLFGCPSNSSFHWSHSLLRFFRQMAVASERFFGGFRQVCFTFISQSSAGVKVGDCWHVSPIQIQSAKNDPIMSLLLGYSLGVFLRYSMGQKPALGNQDLARVRPNQSKSHKMTMEPLHLCSPNSHCRILALAFQIFQNGSRKKSNLSPRVR